MPSPYRREELIADTATLVYLLSGVYYSDDGIIMLLLHILNPAISIHGNQQFKRFIVTYSIRE
jgi:hypothetical protein